METNFITMEIISPTHSYDEIAIRASDVQGKFCFQ